MRPALSRSASSKHSGWHWLCTSGFFAVTPEVYQSCQFLPIPASDSLIRSVLPFRLRSGARCLGGARCVGRARAGGRAGRVCCSRWERWRACSAAWFQGIRHRGTVRDFRPKNKGYRGKIYFKTAFPSRKEGPFLDSNKF